MFIRYNERMISKYKLPIITIASLLLLLIIQKLAVDNYWYVSFPPLDIFMHLFGGICIALSVLYVLKKPTHIIVLTIVAGLCWEVLEVYFDISGNIYGTSAYYIDTVKDLIMDTAGAVVVYLVNKK